MENAKEEPAFDKDKMIYWIPAKEVEKWKEVINMIRSLRVRQIFELGEEKNNSLYSHR